jgi:hypothetical protein
VRGVGASQLCLFTVGDRLQESLEQVAAALLGQRHGLKQLQEVLRR